ncbi:MAG: hypothetical protein FD135_350 [Comamonadaceae bacterium]|nr:MAG: hypothetical protein FD135_350 [Comamonadaceae bacterium]
MMLGRIFLQIGWGIGFALVAQAADVLDVPAQRERIAAQRAGYEADFVKAQQACLARFAVTDCQRAARRVRRLALDELRRQELVLNDLDRQTKAMAEIKRIEENFTPERQQESLQQRQQAEEEAAARQQRSEEKQSSALRAASKPQPVKASDAPAGPSAEESRRLEQNFATKIKEAEQHKADKAKSLSEKEKTPAKPLPLSTQ